MAAELMFVFFVLWGAAGLVLWRPLARGQLRMNEAIYRVAPLLFLWRPRSECAARWGIILSALGFMALGLIGLFASSR